MKINQEIVLLLFLFLYFQESKRLTRIPVFSYLTPSPSTPPDRKKSGRRKCQQLVQEGTWFFFPKAGLTNSCHFLSIRTRFFLSTVIEKIETNKKKFQNHFIMFFFYSSLRWNFLTDQNIFVDQICFIIFFIFYNTISDTGWILDNTVFCSFGSATLPCRSNCVCSLLATRIL